MMVNSSAAISTPMPCASSAPTRACLIWVNFARRRRRKQDESWRMSFLPSPRDRGWCRTAATPRSRTTRIISISSCTRSPSARRTSSAPRELDFFIGKTFLVTHHTEPLADGHQHHRAHAEKSRRRSRAAWTGSPISSSIPWSTPTSRCSTTSPRKSTRWRTPSSSPSNPEPTVIKEFRARKKELTDLQQIVRPQRDVVNRLARGEFKIIRPSCCPTSAICSAI